MSRLALCQTTLHRRCHPWFPDVPAGEAELADGVVVGFGFGVFEAELLADAVGDGFAVGVLVDGAASTVGTGDFLLGPGCTAGPAVVCAVSRLRPPPWLAAPGIPCTDAVAGGAAWRASWPRGFSLLIAGWWPDASTTATIAPTPQSARLIPAAARRRLPARGPTVRSVSPEKIAGMSAVCGPVVAPAPE